MMVEVALFSQDVGADIVTRYCSIFSYCVKKQENFYFPHKLGKEKLLLKFLFPILFKNPFSIRCAGEAFCYSKLMILFPLFFHNPSLWKVGICFSPVEVIVTDNRDNGITRSFNCC